MEPFSGWLEKQSGGKADGKKFSLGNKSNKWDKRFFSIDEEGLLSYYRNAEDKTPAGQLLCHGGGLEQDGLVLHVITDERTLTLRAADEGDAVSWYCALAPFCDGGAARGTRTQSASTARGRNQSTSACRSAALSVDSQRSALGLSSARGGRAAPTPADGNPFASPGGVPTPPPPAAPSASSNPFGGAGGSSGGGGKSPASGGSAGAAAGGVPYGRGAFAASKYVADLRTGELENDEEMQAIEQEIHGHELEMDEATKRMLRMANETVESGAATLSQLHDQGKQLDRIETDQGKVQHNLDTSNKILKGMTSFMGWRAWGQSKDERYSSATPAKAAGGGADAVLKGELGSGSRAAGKGGPSAAAGAAAAGAAAAGGAAGEPPDALDAVAAMMQTMHSQALAMNSEIKKREHQLDQLVDTSVSQNHQIHKNIKDTASVGGKKAKEAAKGAGCFNASASKEMSAVKTGMQTAGEVLSGERSLGSASAKVAAVSGRMAAFRAMQQ